MSKKAVIIGATSGIGRELALLLVRNGYKVGITGRRGELLDEIAATAPDSITPAAFDATSDKAIGETSKLIEKLGGMDMLVFCSGTGHLNPTLDPEPEAETVRLNVEAFTRFMDFAYAYFESGGGGHLAAVTSVMGLRGSGPAPAYAASKAYQINYLEGLRQKASKTNGKVIISDLRPGSVDTDMMKGEGHFWIATPEKAAEVIYRALEKGRPVKYVTPKWKIAGTLLKAIPRGLYKKM